MRTWAYYTLAFLGGLAAAWVVMRVTITPVLGPDNSPALWRFVTLPPLGGLAAFALIYGLLVRTPLGLLFWGMALLTVTASLLIGGGLIYTGVATVTEASLIWLVALFLTGRWLIGWVPQGTA